MEGTVGKVVDWPTGQRPLNCCMCGTEIRNTKEEMKLKRKT